MVLCIGDIAYRADSTEVLEHYFTKHKIPYKFIEELPGGIDVRGAHPSWWKLLAHRILPGYDFIICWDLDLLPRDSGVEVIQEFDMSRICMAWDSHAKKYPGERFKKSFKYNGGLLGIPKEYCGFTEEIFEKNAPGDLPSYEQYYLNEALEVDGISVCELPADINVLFTFSDFETARLKHYTYHPRAKDYIELHREEYFKSEGDVPIKYETRMDMIHALIGKGSNICEVGVFKGDMAKELHRVIEPSRLVLIDLFEGVCGSGNEDGNKFEFIDLDVSYKNLEEYFKGVDGIEIKKGDSVAMLSKYEDESFDMIYIDGDHSYEGCKRDLVESYRKVKRGGYIMGHDYEMNMKKAEKEYSFGVRRAVDTFCEMYSLKINAKGIDGCVSYAIKKVCI